ncbi:hypothetical protein BDP27DRAFT_1370702 [Rhodocollybia butyracea]|uniref:Uncharacterized protein n=1 Tax=Rhodocollybia butyracea TaxID=206335 RepID=A0A9P5TZD8_9AGAR|nr:hypothetical protein BDP27DRAFT_1370702 [Rhodocollybia butyracea]
MRVTIPFASVLLVVSLGCIWATPIAVDRDRMIQQRSEPHLNERATEIHSRASIQDHVTGVSGGVSYGEVRSFRLTRATRADVDGPVWNFIKEGFLKNHITVTMSEPESTDLLPMGTIARFEFKYIELKHINEPDYEGDKYTGTWDPNAKHGISFGCNRIYLYIIMEINSTNYPTYVSLVSKTPFRPAVCGL